MDDVWGLFLGMPHGTIPAAVTTNKNIIMNSFKSSGDIQKKVGGPDRTCSLKKDEHLYFISRGLLYHIPAFIVPAQEFYPWYVAPYQLIVPKLKSILFNFCNIA